MLKKGKFVLILWIVWLSSLFIYFNDTNIIYYDDTYRSIITQRYESGSGFFAWWSFIGFVILPIITIIYFVIKKMVQNRS